MGPVKARCDQGHEWDAEGIPTSCPIPGCKSTRTTIDLRMVSTNRLDPSQFHWERDSDGAEVEFVELGNSHPTKDVTGKRGSWREKSTGR